VFVSLPISALGNKDHLPKRQDVEIAGRVRLVGNVPFLELIVSDAAGQEWYVAPEEEDILSDYEQTTVKIRARYETKDIILADGKKVGEKRILHDIVLLK
jgi:hypothetical protein